MDKRTIAKGKSAMHCILPKNRKYIIWSLFHFFSFHLRRKTFTAKEAMLQSYKYATNDPVNDRKDQCKFTKDVMFIPARTRSEANEHLL